MHRVPYGNRQGPRSGAGRALRQPRGSERRRSRDRRRSLYSGVDPEAEAEGGRGLEGNHAVVRGPGDAGRPERSGPVHSQSAAGDHAGPDRTHEPASRSADRTARADLAPEGEELI